MVQDPSAYTFSNIPISFMEADLRILLREFGNITDVEILFKVIYVTIRSNEQGSMGFGFVTFASAAEADSAQEKLNSTIVEGRIIKVENDTSWRNKAT